jgi:excisionase family DNA binding protein
MLLTVEQVADQTHAAPSTAARWCREGKLPGARRIGRRWLVPAAAVAGDEAPRSAEAEARDAEGGG